MIDATVNQICIDKSAEFGRVISRTHVDETVLVGDYAVSAIVAEDDEAVAERLRSLTVRRILKFVRDNSGFVGDSNRTAAVVEVVGLSAIISITENSANCNSLRKICRILQKTPAP